jgi:Ni,Fe-hydrogenase III small subunit
MTLDATESRHMAQADAGSGNGTKIELPAEVRRLTDTIQWGRE